VDNWCENACDETVLHRSSKSECIEYCKLLLKCALTQTEPRTTLITSFYGGKNNMKKRIFSIMNQTKKRPGRLLLAFIAVIVSMTVFISVSNYKDVFASTKIADSKITETLSSEENVNYETSAKKFTGTTNSVNVKPVTAKTTKSEADTVSKNTSDADTLRKKIVSLAINSKDVPYLWGGNDLCTGVDCSGLVQALYKKLDYDLPRTSREQWKKCEEVSLDNLLPGDLIFYNSTNDTTINHVAIYIGDEQVIHSKNYKVGVTVEDIDYRKPYKAGRIIID
jgi:cell wall-associated NlpC family hydrolase